MLGWPSHRSGSLIKHCQPTRRSGLSASRLKATRHPNTNPHAPNRSARLGWPPRRSGLPMKLCRLPRRSGSTASLLKASQHPNTCSQAPGGGTPDRWHVRPPGRNIFPTYVPTYFQHTFNVFYANKTPEKNDNRLQNRIDIFWSAQILHIFSTYFQHIFDIFLQILNIFLHIFVF